MVASVRPNPFRIRDNELASTGEQGTLRELLSVAAPTEPRLVAIRQAQLEALVRMVPATLIGQVIAATMVAISLFDSLPKLRLGAWIAHRAPDRARTRRRNGDRKQRRQRTDAHDSLAVSG